MDITVTTARDLPMLSPAMVTMVMVMEDTEEVITVMAMVTVSFYFYCPPFKYSSMFIFLCRLWVLRLKNPEVHVDSIRIEFSANEFGPLWY